MKRKSFLFMMLLVCSCVILGACTSKKNENKSTTEAVKTPAEQIVEVFNKEVKEDSNIKELASVINDSIKKITIYDTDVVTLGKKDYVEGFKTEIKGFDKAVAIKPLIGGQPFIAYIFSVKDPETFKKTLEDNADLRWNICTSADEYKSAISGNFVFFVMSKKDFKEEE